MKVIAVLIFLLGCFSAHADCQDEWLTYNSKTQWLSVAYSKGCYDGDLILSSSKKEPERPDTSESSITTPFGLECPIKKQDKNGEVIEFSCRKDGISPLAGATYRFKLIKTTIECDGVIEPDWDHTFICIKGCKPTTPKKLIVPFGEGCS